MPAGHQTGMPLVRIALRKGTKPEFRRALSDSIHRAMVETIKIPEQDKFQVITEHDADLLIYDPAYLGIPRSDGVASVQTTPTPARTLEVRKPLSARTARPLPGPPAVGPEAVSVTRAGTA